MEALGLFLIVVTGIAIAVIIVATFVRSDEIVWVASPTNRIGNNSVTKLSGAQGWDTAFYSKKSGSRTAQVSFYAAQTNGTFEAGLSESPTDVPQQTVMSNGFVVNDAGGWRIDEYGNPSGVTGTYNLQTKFIVEQDGSIVTQSTDDGTGPVIHRTLARLQGLPLYMQANLLSLCTVKNFSFRFT